MKRIRFWVIAALIAASYFVLTVVTAPISFGPMQCRVAEALTVLAVATPAAIPGLTVGCLLANLFGGAAALGIWDVCFGTLTTLVAAIASYALRRIKLGSLPVLSVLPPILLNAAVVGAELAWTLTPSAPGTFWLMAAQVAAGQTLACAALGLPLYAALDKSGVLSLPDQKI